MVSVDTFFVYAFHFLTCDMGTKSTSFLTARVRNEVDLLPLACQDGRLHNFAL